MDAASEWVKARRRACEADLKQLPIPSKRVQGNKLPHGGIRQNSARAGQLGVYNRGWAFRRRARLQLAKHRITGQRAETRETESTPKAPVPLYRARPAVAKKIGRPGPAAFAPARPPMSATSPTHDVADVTSVKTPSSARLLWQITCPIERCAECRDLSRFLRSRHGGLGSERFRKNRCACRSANRLLDARDPRERKDSEENS